MRFPENLKYTKDHEWVKVDGDSVTVGITDHAQSALGDVVYVELPTVGKVLKSGETFGVVESIKAVSDLYAPIAGKVAAVNSALLNTPADINKDPQGSAWMIKISGVQANSLNELMNSADYSKYVDSLK